MIENNDNHAKYKKQCRQIGKSSKANVQFFWQTNTHALSSTNISVREQSVSKIKIHKYQQTIYFEEK